MVVLYNLFFDKICGFGGVLEVPKLVENDPMFGVLGVVGAFLGGFCPTYGFVLWSFYDFFTHFWQIWNFHILFIFVKFHHFLAKNRDFYSIFSLFWAIFGRIFWGFMTKEGVSWFFNTNFPFLSIFHFFSFFTFFLNFMKFA